jgi:hypothetical protein
MSGTEAAIFLKGIFNRAPPRMRAPAKDLDGAISDLHAESAINLPR